MQCMDPHPSTHPHIHTSTHVHVNTQMISFLPPPHTLLLHFPSHTHTYTHTQHTYVRNVTFRQTFEGSPQLLETWHTLTSRSLRPMLFRTRKMIQTLSLTPVEQRYTPEYFDAGSPSCLLPPPIPSTSVSSYPPYPPPSPTLSPQLPPIPHTHPPPPLPAPFTITYGVDQGIESAYRNGSTLEL